MTLIQCIERMSQRLDAAQVAFGHGTTNAFDEAAWLVLWRLALPLDELDEHAGRTLDAAELAAVESLIDERITTRKPAAYLTGEAWLHGLPFFVDERCIVPRSLLAEPLGEGVLDTLLPSEPRRVLDMCTGNGSLAVMAALAWPRAEVLATDLSADALALARRNVDRHGLAARIELRQGDGLRALHRDERFGLVLCNPPYVNVASMAALPPEFRAEPAMALAGGEDGMDFVRPLLIGLAKHLDRDGAVLLEIGHERAHFEAAFAALAPLWLTTSAGDDQVLMLTCDQLVRAHKVANAGARPDAPTGSKPGAKPGAKT